MVHHIILNEIKNISRNNRGKRRNRKKSMKYLSVVNADVTSRFISLQPSNLNFRCFFSFFSFLCGFGSTNPLIQSLSSHLEEALVTIRFENTQHMLNGDKIRHLSKIHTRVCQNASTKKRTRRKKRRISTGTYKIQTLVESKKNGEGT